VRTVALDRTNVRPVLQRLWRESVKANREMIACIGGDRDGDTFRISRAAPLEALVPAPDSVAGKPEFSSDSVSVSRYLTDVSIATCRPPRWVGTVHTHSARQDDLRYPKFSSDDRTVISRWHERWRHESVFCVLFAYDRVPYCEYREGARPKSSLTSLPAIR